MSLSLRTKKIETSFLILFLSALIIRFYYFSYDLPLIIDGFDNFTYATAINFYGHLPTEWTPANNGWPIFLSFWFSIINLDNTLQYMQLQKIISIFVSSLITIPVYYLCKQYFNKKIALVGVALIAFEPRLILNSLLGITDPLFILLATSSLLLFLKYERRMMLISFILASSATIVRSEGLFLFFTLTILFLIKYKITKEVLKTYLPCLIIFILILIPIIDYRMEVIGTDGIFQRGVGGTSQIISMVNETGNGNSPIINGLTLFIKYSGWILIPSFLVFLPFGIILFFKQRNKESNFIIIFVIICSIPILYAYFRQAQDTRYLFSLFPIFSLISLYAVKTYLSKFTKKDLILFLMIVGILVSSITFYEFKKIDYEKEREFNEIAKNLPITIGGLNTHPTITQYIGFSELPDKWPFVFYDETRKIKTIKTSTYNNEQTKEHLDLDNFILNHKNDLTHLIVNDNSNLPEFLQEIYLNEEKFEYLDKVFDSKNVGFGYHVKLFEINFEKFNSHIIEKTLLDE
jgi:hypothetical protein